MKTIVGLSLVFAALASATGSESTGELPKLTSLHGTLIMMVSEGEGMPFEIWAKANNLRSEFTADTQKIITIQRGNTLYTYRDGSPSGEKQFLPAGLASMGLVKQIEEVKAHGTKSGVETIEGKRYQVYKYDVNFPKASSVVYLSVDTSLPIYWLSAVMTSEKEATVEQMIYRNMEANVEIPDELFDLPQDVDFSAARDESPPTTAEQPDDDDTGVIDEPQRSENDKLAVVISPRVEVRTGKETLAVCRLGDVLDVSTRRGNWVLVDIGSKKGWIGIQDVAPLENAYNHLSRRIEQQPRSAEALSGRGRFLAWMAQHTTQIRHFEKGTSETLAELALSDFDLAAQYGADVEVLTGRGLSRGLTGDFPGALADFNKALQLEPQSADALLHRALTLIKLSRLDEAIADCDQLLRLDANDAEAHSLRCLALGLKGRWDEAMIDGNRAIEVDPALASAYMRRGAIWAGKGDDVKALADYNKAIRLGDDSARANRARILYKQGKLPECIADLTLAIEMAPDEAEYYFQRGTAWLQLDRVDDAITDLSKVIELEPTAAAAYSNRGAAWAIKNDNSKAMEDFSTAVRLDPDVPGNYENRARLYAQLRQYQDEIKDLTEYMNFVPDDPSAYVNRGMAWHFSAEYDKAIADFNTAIELAPSESYIYICRGSTWNGKKEFDRAIADFNQAIELNPSSAEAHTYRGAAWQGKHDTDKALADFDRAVQLDPASDIARANRGSFWLSQNEYGKAVTDFREAIRLNPDRAAVLNELAWLYATAPDSEFRSGDQAVKLATRSCELADWNDYSYLDTLAAAYAELGDYQSAIKWQSKSLQIAPEGRKEEARNRLELFREKQPYRDDADTSRTS